MSHSQSSKHHYNTEAANDPALLPYLCKGILYIMLSQSLQLFSSLIISYQIVPCTISPPLSSH
jgi:hypothetical protein